MEEFVKMSPKGQLVVPQEIRKKEGLKPGDRFIAVRVSEGIVFKKIELPDLKKIGEQVKERFKVKG